MKKRMLIVLAIASMLFVAITYAAQPGTQDDPLVTKSYLEKEIAFKVVEVPAGKSVIGSAGTEMILRMGTCSAVGTQKGGVSDVTMGYDLANGTNIQGNHLIIVPLDDGRGVKTSTNCLIMIKGKYTIK